VSFDRAVTSDEVNSLAVTPTGVSSSVVTPVGVDSSLSLIGIEWMDR